MFSPTGFLSIGASIDDKVADLMPTEVNRTLPTDCPWPWIRPLVKHVAGPQQMQAAAWDDPDPLYEPPGVA